MKAGLTKGGCAEEDNDIEETVWCVARKLDKERVKQEDRIYYEMDAKKVRYGISNWEWYGLRMNMCSSYAFVATNSCLVEVVDYGRMFVDNVGENYFDINKTDFVEVNGNKKIFYQLEDDERYVLPFSYLRDDRRRGWCMFDGGVLTGIAEAICEYSKRVFMWDVARKTAEFVNS